MSEENTRILHIDKFYSSLPNMKSKFDRYGRRDYFKGNTIEEYAGWKINARKILSDLIGLDKMDQVDLMPDVVERTILDGGIVREKVLIMSEEDIWIPIYILIPPVKKPKVFIAPPGHQGAGKYSVAGLSEIPAVKDAIKKFNYDYGLQLAKSGYVAVCPDCRGFGERRDAKLQSDDEHSFLTSSCFHLAHMAEPLGETVIGMCVWDLMKITDYILTRTDFDTRSLSCLGFSGGGMQTLYFAALDDRIENVYISGYMYGFKDSLLVLNGNCSCNYVPHLWEHFDMGDIGSLIAPRNLMIQSCRDDHLNGSRGLENVFEQVEIIRKIYRLYGREEFLVHDIFEGGHCWHGDNMAAINKKFGI